MDLQLGTRILRGAILLSLLLIFTASGCSTLERIEAEVFKKSYNDYEDDLDLNHRVEDLYTLAEIMDDTRTWKHRGLTFQLSARVDVNEEFWRHPLDIKNVFTDFRVTFRIKF
jgi:hypothetical protein